MFTKGLLRSNQIVTHYLFCRNHSNIDPIELCSTLTSAINKPGSMVDYGDMLGLTPLHVAAKIGAGVCCIHLIQAGGICFKYDGRISRSHLLHLYISWVLNFSLLLLLCLYRRERMWTLETAIATRLSPLQSLTIEKGILNSIFVFPVIFAKSYFVLNFLISQIKFVQK